MNPYPWYGFEKWKLEELGPYPRCLPFSMSIINRSAIWLFGKQISFRFPGNDEIEKELKRFWKLNKMDIKLVPLAKKGGQEGSVSIKFSYNSKDKVPLRLQVLSNVDHVKFFYNPHNKEELIMARVQYPFQSLDTGNWFWYREEWTNDLYIEYEPIKIENFRINDKNPYVFLGAPVFPDIDTTVNWKVKRQSPNRFGLIPIIPIQNQSNGTEFGVGDLFGLFPTIDRINLTYHLMDRSNQLDIDPRTIYIDLEPKDGDNPDFPSHPGTQIDLQTVESDDGSSRQGKVQLLETSGAIREQLNIYCNELKQQLFDATGAVFPRQEHITNKGSLTQSVLIQMYAPMLEVIGEKQKNYGPNGIILLLQSIVLGLSNLGVSPFNKVKGIEDITDEKLDFSLTWFSQFMQSEDEKLATFDRLSREIDAEVTVPKRAIKAIADMEGFDLTDSEISEIEEKVNDRLKRQREQLSDGQSPGNKPRTPGSNQSRVQKRGTAINDAE